MSVQIFPSVIKRKISFFDALKLIGEKDEHMDASLPMYDGYRRAFHYNRYIFANKYNHSSLDVILDIACGFGYGSHYLSINNFSVTGSDLSEFAIKYAKKYHKSSNISYIQGDASTIKFKEKFDKIISFETIEHLPTDELVDKYLLNLKTQLKDDGLFICSSPNKWGLTKYHFQDYNYEEFKNKLIKNGFEIIDSYKQNSGNITSINNHGETGGIYHINNNQDAKNAEVIILIAKKGT